MGERDWRQRYQAARDYADEQAAKLGRGEEIEEWAYEVDWQPGEPEPPKIAMSGAAWVAHAYEIAADAASFVSTIEGRARQAECQRLAADHREKAEQI